MTDAGVITGCTSSEAIRKRSVHGFTQFVAPGWNEALLEAAGFRLIETENRNASLLKNANGRLAALQGHRAELAEAVGADELRAQEAYLETVLDLARRAALSRVMYLAEVHGPPAS